LFVQIWQVEAATVNRAIMLANQANTPIVISQVTGKMSADVIARNRRHGMLPHFLSLSQHETIA